MISDHNQNESAKSEFITASGRRFVSDARSDFHYTSFETKKLLRAYSPESNAPLLYKKASLIELEPHVAYYRDKMTLSFNICDRMSGACYVLKDISDFLTAVEECETVSYGKHLSFTHDKKAFTEETLNIISFLNDYFREKRTVSYPYGKGHNKEIELKGHEIDEFFASVNSLYFVNKDFRARHIDERLLEKDETFPPIDLSIEKTANGVTFEAAPFTMFEGYSNIYFEKKRKIHVIPRKDCASILPFLTFLSSRRTENELFIAEKDLPLFSSGLLPVLNEYMNVSIDGFDVAKYSPDVPKFRIYLDMPDTYTITCDVQAVYNADRYDEQIFHIFGRNFDDGINSGGNDARGFIKRDLFKESKIAKTISPFFDNMDNKKGVLYIEADESSEDKIYSFLTQDIKILYGLGDVYLSEAIHSINIKAAPRINLGVSVVSDLLELSIVPEDISVKELDDILNRYDRRKKYYRLKSGEVLDLSSKEMDILYSLRDGLLLSKNDLAEGHVSIPKFRALFLDELADKSKDYEFSHISLSREFKKLVNTFAGSYEKEYDIPDSLQDVLRDYQKAGYYWLRTLKANGFGGILADDMGLGKTLQVLSLLLSMKEEAKRQGINNRCSLIVCPASLVYNWQHEIQRFTPELNCELAVGIKPDRERVTSEIDEEKTDVIITSYDLLRRDIDLYRYLSFECVIIDEAQFIKNPSTQVAKAVKSVKAGFKAALTGTPIENRLSELWSIFDFCMPGYLFNYKNFKEKIEIPVVSDGDGDEMQHLRRMIAPFVLRRLKKDVLKDLPDKLEENIVSQMTKEQEQLYKAHLQRVKMLVHSKDDEEIKRDRIAILSELTRLRQLCCDPGLIYENYNGGSAKADLLLEMVKSAAESGHKVLLFSQFTSMLDRISKLLAKEGISHYLLTGATKKEDRIKMVDAFQEDDTPVFCISLKAGGTGLNLTAADIVIHYDHWWNIAVQNQATDRAHRIGQKNVVTVYRLIMKDTIEERIILLQNKKKELADQLLNSDSLSTPKLSKEELLELLG
ncbi:Superfamily II DNA or RNA helicase, SNF2 family [Butyrivibrio hungatei DSM 14810]|uniref:Superfamily II DNA or RNA helicase, SNF2 family n=1 Tax=Butyrivibrio hungatei DSM 14810 TaxID=1121132 RepID=A0A1M7RRW1_9FIRM|nr:SNF2 helicase associated domain-containing protein [Butyrivibrio hungatei]SHN48900.1 Superfamily II DNA or RNA helicase, SNF2 family [Butyrivibrio hungatei DSM 14810]